MSTFAEKMVDFEIAVRGPLPMLDNSVSFMAIQHCSTMSLHQK